MYQFENLRRQAYHMDATIRFTQEMLPQIAALSNAAFRSQPASFAKIFNCDDPDDNSKYCSSE
ncbi:hypothetical protein A0J61_09765 [Choanephora cucurbitarum]|uniref:Uncharacterized protein n=1 Tax=Choanephora cucurbitarum TaxID=101091 RepID=A0A1C7MZ55_9FUNG|nr:hypothetical protein A0J61_09765 [Choanephora cucurbitarum]